MELGTLGAGMWMRSPRPLFLACWEGRGRNPTYPCCPSAPPEHHGTRRQALGLRGGRAPHGEGVLAQWPLLPISWQVKPVVSQYLHKKQLPYNEDSYLARFRLFLSRYEEFMVQTPPITELVGLQ